MKYSQFIKSDIDKVLDKCNLTKDEEDIFNMLCKDKNTVEISIELAMSERKVYRIKRRIKEKIERCDIK